MSENPPPPPSDLQFDKVEYGPTASPGADHATATSLCASCQQPLTDTYYEANGKLLCPRCKEAIQSQLTGGSGFFRFMRAIVFGFIAAVIGSLGYWAARAATGWEIGIVAIAMGWLVGIAVRRGARMRGGFLYQLLAAGLTYLSISWSFLPMVMGDMDKYSTPDNDEIEQVDASMRRDEAAMNRLKTSGLSAEDDGILDAVSKHNENVDPTDPALSTSQVLKFSTGTVVIPPERSMLSRLTLTSDSKVLSGSQTVREASTGELKPKRYHLPPGPRKVLITIIMLIVSLVFPLLVAKSSPILALIYLFGLMQAWRMNKRPHIVITGPYQLAGAATPATSTPPPLPPGA